MHKSFEVQRKFVCDTVVIGGGSTGIAAAIASARNGASTMLECVISQPAGNNKIHAGKF